MEFKIILLTAITLFSVNAKDNQVTVIRPPTCNIKRPCSDFDIKCIQKEFLKRNWLGDNVGNQAEGEPLIIDAILKTPLAFFKITIYGKETIITGLDKGIATEFYINEDTNKAVLSCLYSNVVVNSTGFIDIHRAGQENIQFISSGGHEEYKTVKTTTIITGLNGPPDMATYVDECKLKTISFGDGMDKIKDKDVKCVFKQIEKYIDIGLKEASIQRAQIFQDYFINNVIGKNITPPAEEAPSAVPPTAYVFATATAAASSGAFP